MEQAQFEGSELASGDEANATAPTPPAGATTVPRLEANEGRRISPTRRKLSDEQEGEVTRLYADTTTPVSEIARKFGIGESSVYRLAQRHGAALRGRQTPPGAWPAKPATDAAARAPERTRAASAAKPPETPSTAAAAGAPARVRPHGASAAVGRFRVRFLMERVVQARDIRDALRKAEAFEAIEVTAIMHEE